MSYSIPFNKPYLFGKETKNIEEAVRKQKLSGNGEFTKRCHQYFERRYNVPKVLLTSSCTDALEMAAMLCDIEPGDEVILPSYTFVSTANAFYLRGAKLVFADSSPHNPNVSVDTIKPLITAKTKVIVVVHYAGVSCDMDPIMSLARERGIFVVEDAAHAIESFYKGRPLGTIGDFGTFSFHETKNVTSGEGGLLLLNNSAFATRAEIIWEKGTNRAAFARGTVGSYNWVDIGSSFLPSEVTAAFLFAQLENLESIQERRRSIWFQYFNNLQSSVPLISLANIPDYATVNGHIFYVVMRTIKMRDDLLQMFRDNGILACFTTYRFTAALSSRGNIRDILYRMQIAMQLY